MLNLKLNKAKIEVPKEATAHKDSMRRKIGMLRKVAAHHGYKEKAVTRFGAGSETSAHISSGKKSGYVQTYEHPQTKHQLNVQADSPNDAIMPALGWHHSDKDNNLIDSSAYSSKEWQYPVHELDHHLSKVHGTERLAKKSLVLVFDLRKAKIGYSSTVDTTPEQRDHKIQQAESIRKLLTDGHGFKPFKGNQEDSNNTNPEYNPKKFKYHSEHHYHNPETGHHVSVSIPHSAMKNSNIEWSHTGLGRTKRGFTVTGLAAHLEGRTHRTHSVTAKSFSDFSDKGKLSPEAKKRVRNLDRRIKVIEGYRKTAESAGYISEEEETHKDKHKKPVLSEATNAPDESKLHLRGLRPSTTRLYTKPSKIQGKAHKLSVAHPTDITSDKKEHFSDWAHYNPESPAGDNNSVLDKIKDGKGHGKLVRHLKQIHPDKADTIKSKPICSLCKGKHLIKVVFKSDGYEEKALRACPICHNIKEI